jgi:hypothetical protein
MGRKNRGETKSGSSEEDSSQPHDSGKHPLLIIALSSKFREIVAPPPGRVLNLQ